MMQTYGHFRPHEKPKDFALCPRMRPAAWRRLGDKSLQTDSNCCQCPQSRPVYARFVPSAAACKVRAERLLARALCMSLACMRVRVWTLSPQSRTENALGQGQLSWVWDKATLARGMQTNWAMDKKPFAVGDKVTFNGGWSGTVIELYSPGIIVVRNERGSACIPIEDAQHETCPCGCGAKQFHQEY